MATVATVVVEGGSDGVPASVENGTTGKSPH